MNPKYLEKVMKFNKSTHYLLSMVVLVGSLVLYGCDSEEAGEGAEVVAETQDEAPLQRVRIITKYGDMVAELSNETPQHRDNFMSLVDSGFYDGLLFHRVMKDFMVQGGDPNSRNAELSKTLGNGGPGYTLPAEIRDGMHHFRGALAAARQPDVVNPNKESSGSQFYIVQGRSFRPAELMNIAASKARAAGDTAFTVSSLYSDEDIARYEKEGGTPFLDRDYTVFGQIIEGMEVVDSIAAVQVTETARPMEPVRMKIERID